MEMELRMVDSDISINEDGDLVVQGYVNKTNEFSNILGRAEKFKEKILPGAFRSALERGKEIHFLAEHDNKKILASTRNGSLELREDDEGLFMSAKIAPTSWGKDYYELIKSGILRNMSFGFRSIKDTWQKTGTLLERTISDLDLFEVSVVRDPAYSQSAISARGIDLIEDVEIPKDVLNEVAEDKKQFRASVDVSVDVDQLAELIYKRLSEDMKKREQEKEVIVEDVVIEEEVKEEEVLPEQVIADEVKEPEVDNEVKETEEVAQDVVETDTTETDPKPDSVTKLMDFINKHKN